MIYVGSSILITLASKHFVERMQSVVVWGLLLFLQFGDCLQTGGVGLSKDSVVHLYSRGDGTTLQQEWSPKLVEKLQLMKYDRAKGNLIGYDTVTGKVLSQRRKIINNQVVSIHDALVVATSTSPIASADGSSSDLDRDAMQCLYFDNGGVGAQTDLGREVLTWRACESSSVEAPFQSWQITYNYGGKMTICNHRDHRFRCLCSLKKLQGLRKQLGSRQVTSCRPDLLQDLSVRSTPLAAAVDPQFDSIYDPKRTENLKFQQRTYCALLTNVMRSKVSFYILSSSVVVSGMQHKQDESRLALLKRNSVFDQPRLDVYQQFGRDIDQQPRAQIASLMKRVVELVHTLNTVCSKLALITADLVLAAWSYIKSLPSAQVATTSSQVFLYLHNTGQLHTAKSSTTKSDLLKNAADIGAILLSFSQHHNGGDSWTPEGFMCSATLDTRLVEFLSHPNTHMTPEYANMTKLARSAAQYTLEHLQCIHTISTRIKALLDCFLWGESRRVVDTGTLDQNDLFGTELLAMVLGGRHLRASLDSGMTSSQVADSALRHSEEVAISAFKFVNSVALLYSDITPKLPNQNSTEHEILNFSEDVWCCGAGSDLLLVYAEHLPHNDTPITNLPCKLHTVRHTEKVVARMMNFTLYAEQP